MTSTEVNIKLHPQHSSNSFTKKKKKKPLLPWPTRRSLPTLHDSVLKGLREERLEFPINEACQYVVAGFTDGTLRLFELNGNIVHPKTPPRNDSSPEDEDEEEALFDVVSTKSTMVCSKTFQRYGAVACQIHAKGVHTSLIMKVDVSPDGLFAFGGVARGSMELVAVDLSKLQGQTGDILDLISVESHSDAKLRGFGACTRLKGTNKYLLLTGKGIKNIHIWAFSPLSKNHKWECLYDTQTNGNTITFLHFRYHTSGHLQALSKSDGQKVRVWDLQHEQQRYNKDVRPKRPPFTDIPSTESALGIAGNFCLGGYHSITVVNLDILESTLNYTELPLPGSNIRRIGRQQRGELQTLQSVACMSADGCQALLEMSDGSILQYSQGQSMPQVNPLPSTLFRTNGEQRSNSDLDSTCTLGLAQVGANGTIVAAMATHTTAGNGAIVLRMIQGNITTQETPLKLKKGFSMSVITLAQRIIEDSPDRKVQKECTAASPDSMGQPERKHMVCTGVAVSPEHSKADTPPGLKNYIAMKRFFEPKVNKKVPVVKEVMRQHISKLLTLVAECNPAAVLADKLADPKTDFKIPRVKSTDDEYFVKATDNLTKVNPAVILEKTNLTESLTKIKSVENTKKVKSVNDFTKIMSSDNLTAERHSTAEDRTVIIPDQKITTAFVPIKDDSMVTVEPAFVHTNTILADGLTKIKIDDNVMKAKSANGLAKKMSSESLIIERYTEMKSADGRTLFTSAQIATKIKDVVTIKRDSMVKTSNNLTSVESAVVLTMANLAESFTKIKTFDNVAKMKSTNDFTKIMSSDCFIAERHKSAEDRTTIIPDPKIPTTFIPIKGDLMVEATHQLTKPESTVVITKANLADSLTKIKIVDIVLKVKSVNDFTKIMSSDSLSAERHTKMKSAENHSTIPSAQNTTQIKAFVHTNGDCMGNATNQIATVASTDVLTKCKFVISLNKIRSAENTTKVKSCDNVTETMSADTSIKVADGFAKTKASNIVFKIRSASHMSSENVLERKTSGSCTIIKSPDNIIKPKSAKKLLTRKHAKRPSKTVKSKSPLTVPRKSIAESIDIRRHSGSEQEAIDALLSVCERSGTSVPTKTRVEFSENGHIPLTLPPPLTRKISKSNLRRRILRLNEMNDNSSFEVTRMKLALEHRSAHELIRKRVLSSVDTIIRTFASQTTVSADEARSWLEEIIQTYEDLLDGVLSRQRLEAGALGARQTLSNGGQRVASLAVSFPFPEVFDQARESLSSLLVKRRRLSP